MKRLLASLLAPCLCLTLIVCSEDVTPIDTALVCEPGRVVACPCLNAPGGGAQQCRVDGSGWEACLCPEPSAEVDAAPDLSSDPPALDMAHDAADLSHGSSDMAPDLDATPDLGVDMAPDMATPDDPRLRGQQLYMQHCAACHGVSARGSVAGPDLIEEIEEELEEESPQRVRRELIEVMREGEDDMPPIAVSEEEASLIADYLFSLVR